MRAEHENDDHKINIRSQRDVKNDTEVGWSIINEEVDTVIPLLLEHLQKLQIEHLQLPDIKENLSLVSSTLNVDDAHNLNLERYLQY